MLQAKNTITAATLQGQLVTQSADFLETSTGGERFFAVTTGVLLSDALNEASTLLGAVDSVASKLQDGHLDANEIYLIRFVIGAAKALIDASTSPVEFGNRGGAE
ncbi:DUF3077 domain-containing protein [Pseudomonas sp. HN8-3]|uniref:DUF3077 domain-containing protein n=1 Tax=Pseudomonas sp. HN8-3 TaxID=2886361 RepID=UPI001E3177F6|nr:DUF3077 domain-containing protein [Pseudomonas sp. HN8-3]UEH06694.1 DUF3077 domain-containing protein [Pseudomonas sp. HN8-3]